MFSSRMERTSNTKVQRRRDSALPTLNALAPLIKRDFRPVAGLVPAEGFEGFADEVKGAGYHGKARGDCHGGDQGP